MAAINSIHEDSSVDSGNNDDPHSSKYIRLNDGSRRRSATTVSQSDEYGDEEDRFSSGKKSSNTLTMAQDAHLRHYQEHLEERRMKSKRLREGKMVTLLRKKPTVVEKRDVACQVTPADLGLDDWEDEDEDEEEEYEENDYELKNAQRPYSRPLAAPGPGPWQDVSTTNFNAEAYQQWYGDHWLGQSESQYENSAEILEEDLPELTEEQTYRYVYYYYNYYAAMEANDGMPSNIYDESQNYIDSTVASHPGAWQDTDNTAKESSSKKQMRNLFDEWRQKYESWYRATFGKDVRETQREEDVTIMAHKAQLEAARLAQLREEQELRLERPGRPESLLPAPPIIPERVDTPVLTSSSENQQSLLPPPPPPSAPPPETPPPPPPETPRPETPAAQVAAAAAAAHILGANMSTPADVAAAIARLSNTDLTAILSSVNRATFNPHKAPESKPKEDGSDTPVTTAAPTLIRLPPLPVIGLPNPLATPIFPPPMPIAIRRDGLTATATVLPAPSAAATILTPHMVVALPPALPASLAPPALPSALPSIPQTMLLQPTIKFGPPFKPFGVFQGRTEDKWGPDAPLGRYGQRKEEVTKEIKARQDSKKIHQSDPVSDSQKTSDRDNGQVNGNNSALLDTTNSTNSSSGSMKGDGLPDVLISGGVDQHDEDKISEKENNEDILSDRDESDIESVSSDDSLISTRTQSIAIGPRRSRVAPSVASAVGPGPNARTKLLMANAVNTSSIPVEKLTSLAESAAKRAVSDGLWYAPSQPLNSLRLPKQAMIHTLQSHLKPKINDLQNREKDPKLQLTLSYAKFFIDVTRHLLDMSVQFVMGSMHRLPTERARYFYGEDLPEEVSNGMKLCDVYVGDVFISQGGANSSLGAKEAAARQAFKVLSRPGYILGSTRLWQDVDHLVLCISEFPLTVPILPPFLLDPCSPAIVHGPQPPSEIGQVGPGGDGVDEETGWEMEDEEDWLIQSVAINPKPLENLWLYENYDERSVVAALYSIGERKYERLLQKMQRKKRRERLEAEDQAHRNASDEDIDDINSSLVSKRERRASSISQSGDDVHETALADMAALTLAEEEAEVAAVEATDITDERETTAESDPVSLTILSRSCDFSHMMLSVEVEMNRDATFTCCIFIDRQFCADATDQPTAQQARMLAASRALTLLRLTQPAVGLDGPEVGEEAVVDSLMWITRDKTIRPLHSIMTEHGVKGFEWDRLFMYYAESAAIEPFFISQRELPRLKWSEVKKEAEKWGLLVKESRIGTPQEGEDADPLSLTVCKRMPLTTVKRRLMRQGRCGHFLLLRRGVYPTSEDEEYYVSDDEDEDDGNRTSLKLTVNEIDLTPPVAVEVKEEPPDEEALEDLIFLGGAPTSSECEIIDDLPKTIIPGFDY